MLAFIARRAAVQLEVRKVKGSIIGGLTLDYLQIRRPPLQAEIRSVRLQWLPQSFLAGRVAVKEFLLQGVVIQDDRPERKEPPDLSWPRAAGIVATLGGSIDSFELKEIVYRRLHKPPVKIGGVSGNLIWWSGMLYLRNILIVTSPAAIRGEASAGFMQPSLNIDISADLNPAAAGMKKCFLKARLMQSTRLEQVTGDAAFVGSPRQTGVGTVR